MSGRGKPRAIAANGPAVRRGSAFGKIVGVVVAIPALYVLFPTVMVLVPLLAPTLIAWAVDRNAQKHFALSVTALNLCGALPAVIDLWNAGHTTDAAGAALRDVYSWFQAYGMAALSWAIFAMMTPVVQVFYAMRTRGRLDGLEQRRKELKARWGDEVAGESGKEPDA